tara:strand:+ start:58 stop:270 length:213 start_codon:yes stop_codon:yes gene_type:complete
MFTVLFDADRDFDNPTISAPNIPNAQTALNFIGSLKQDFGMSADECNDQFLVIRLSDGKSCHPQAKRKTA